MYREPRDRIELLFQMLQDVLSDLDLIKIKLNIKENK